MKSKSKNRKPVKKSKVKKIRLDFAQKLAQNLRNLGEVEEGSFGDNSGRWVTLKFNGKELCFSFDMKGEEIDRIGLYEDIVEVTGQKRLWGN